MNENNDVSQICDHENLANYVMTLRNDLLANPESWENSTLESFLNAMANWIMDAEGYYRNHNKPLPSTESLQAIAEVLSASKFYE